MLKKLLVILALGVALFAIDFKEGVNYQVLKNPINAPQGSVIKIYSVYCPFCYKYDKAVDEKVITSMTDVKYDEWHLKTKGTYGQQASNMLAVAKARDIASGHAGAFDRKSLVFQIREHYYDAYHAKKKRWAAGEDAFYKFGLGVLGLDKAGLMKELATPKAKAIHDLWDACYNVAKVQGIPAFVVNGKYLVITKQVKGRTYLKNIFEYLLKK